MQAAFAAALLDPDHALPPGLHAADTDERFAVYRNNVTSGLIRALAAGFPAVQSVVGEEFFAAMAALFVRVSPPQSPVLLQYGEAFPAFLETFQPAADLPYLADLARLELAYRRAFHAADAVPLGGEALHDVAPERIGELRVSLHPALQLLHSPHPVATIWAMNTGRQALAEITDWRSEDILVLRPQVSVDVILLAPGETEFLQALQSGATLTAAAASAFDASGDFNPAAALAALFMRGAASTVHFPETLS